MLLAGLLLASGCGGASRGEWNVVFPAFRDGGWGIYVVSRDGGAPVRIGDLGRAVEGVEEIREAAWLGGQRAVIIDVHKQQGFNINQTVEQVKAALPELLAARVSTV